VNNVFISTCHTTVPFRRVSYKAAYTLASTLPHKYRCVNQREVPATYPGVFIVTRYTLRGAATDRLVRMYQLASAHH
jgi:hypothetical protein